jgi:hypothetical protein
MLGMLMALQAFRVAFPNAPPYRAALLILFLPSMLFWPSSLGKDALMVGVVGLMALGAARFVTGRKPAWGMAWIAISGLLMLQIRPHLLLISAVALAMSQLAVAQGSFSTRGLLARVLILLAVVPLLVSGIGRIDTMLGSGAGDDLLGSLDKTTERTAIGGSAFTPVAVRTPLDIPGATVTVLYRPFLFEARSAPVLISSLEGTLLLLLTLLSASWVWRLGPLVARNPFAAFCGTYVLAFVIAFSNIANAGILSRQRTQLFPFLMIVVAAAYETRQIRRQELAHVELEQGQRLASVGGPSRPRPSSPLPSPIFSGMRT